MSAPRLTAVGCYTLTYVAAQDGRDVDWWLRLNIQTPTLFKPHSPTCCCSKHDNCQAKQKGLLEFSLAAGLRANI